MTRQEVPEEIEGMFGLVPGMFMALTNSLLEMKWGRFKLVKLEPDAIPNKYRKLMG